jgi:hypothetical protein
VAGSDTSAGVISSVFHYILSEIKYFERYVWNYASLYSLSCGAIFAHRLRKEIDEYFPLKGGEVPADNSTKLSELPFLNAVM